MRRLVLLAAVVACREAGPPPELTVVGESTRLRMESARPAKTAWYDGERVTLIAARGEVLGIQVVSREPRPVSLALTVPGVQVSAFDVDSFVVRRPSTAMYGGSQGAGTYPDALRPVADVAATNPAYFEITVGPSVEPGTYTGELHAGAQSVPVQLDVSPVTLPPLAVGVWALENPRELGSSAVAPTPTELACIGMFRTHGVLLSPDIHPDAWPARKPLVAEVRDVPVWIPSEPAAAATAVQFWIAALAGTGQVPFSIAIDEPRTPDAQKRVWDLATAVRAAGGGPTTFRYAVTDDIHPDRYGDLIDLYISLHAKRTDRAPRWTYNGAPPHAGSFVLDAASPGARTWGWIAWRWNIGLWYVWDALYWHDRHNRKGAPLPGKPLIARLDPVSFDDGGDHGNFDGVLALPDPAGCQRTLRLAAIRRGLQDKALLDLAAACDRTSTSELAARMVPRALGDAPKGSRRSWSSDESVWERARRELLAIAASCQRSAAR